METIFIIAIIFFVLVINKENIASLFRTESTLFVCVEQRQREEEKAKQQLNQLFAQMRQKETEERIAVLRMIQQQQEEQAVAKKALERHFFCHADTAETKVGVGKKDVSYLDKTQRVTRQVVIVEQAPMGSDSSEVEIAEQEKSAALLQALLADIAPKPVSAQEILVATPVEEAGEVAEEWEDPWPDSDQSDMDGTDEDPIVVDQPLAAIEVADIATATEETQVADEPMDAEKVDSAEMVAADAWGAITNAFADTGIVNAQAIQEDAELETLLDEIEKGDLEDQQLPNDALLMLGSVLRPWYEARREARQYAETVLRQIDQIRTEEFCIVELDAKGKK